MDITGKSDPFVVVSLGTKSHKSRVVYQNLNPVWNEMFEFEDFDFDMDVIVRIYDWDLLGSALLRSPFPRNHFSASTLVLYDIEWHATVNSPLPMSFHQNSADRVFGRGYCEPACTLGFTQPLIRVASSMLVSNLDSPTFQNKADS